MSNINPTKVCTKCLVEKPITEFHKCKTRYDGFQYRCKKCTKAYQRKWTNTPHGKTSRKISRLKYLRSEKGSSYWRKYRKTPKGSESSKLAARKYRQTVNGKLSEANRKLRDTHKITARRRVHNAVYKGIIPKASSLKCNNCHNQASHYHHHNGYSKKHRLDVIPLCVVCHMLIHHPAKITS